MVISAQMHLDKGHYELAIQEYKLSLEHLDNCLKKVPTDVQYNILVKLVSLY